MTTYSAALEDTCLESDAETDGAMAVNEVESFLKDESAGEEASRSSGGGD